MKKTTLLLVIVLFASSLIAQEFNVVSAYNYKNTLTTISSKDVYYADTLYPPVLATSLPCADTFTYYSLGAAGYLTGNGALGANSLSEVAEGYAYAGNAIVEKVIAIMLRKSGTTSNINAKIYSTGTGFVPSAAALGTSSNVAISTIPNTGVSAVEFVFSSPVAVSGNFAASVVLPNTTGDTVIVFGTRFGCVDATKDDRASAMVGTSWMDYKTVLAGNSYPSIDVHIFAVIYVTQGVSEINENLINVYPNPANSQFIIASSYKMNTVKVFNNMGQLVFSENASDNLMQINSADFQDGIYFVKIETVNGSVIKTINIIK